MAVVITITAVVFPFVVESPTAHALNYSDYDVVYEINDFSLTGNSTYPNSASLNCVDKNTLSLATNHCTFKQALTQSNGTTGNTLITVDAGQMDNDYTAGCFISGSTKCNKAYGNQANAPVINISKVSSYMCDGSTRKCGTYDTEADKAVFEIYTRGSTTVDFQGKLGISTWDDSPYYSTIGITSSSVKLLHVNGIHSSETVIMITSGVTDVEIGYGSCDSYDMTNSYKWSAGWVGWKQNNYATERFLVIHGSHSAGTTGIYLHDWAVGHLYDGAGNSGYGVILQTNSNTENLRLENYVVASGTSGGSCDTGGVAGCTTTGLFNNGAATLSKSSITGMQVTHSRGSRSPIILSGSNMTINGLTISNSRFNDLSSNAVMDFNYATVNNLTITGDEPKNDTYYSQFVTTNTTAKDYAINFNYAKVTGLSIKNSLWQKLPTNYATFQLTYATVSGATISGNKFESLKVGSSGYGVFSFYYATQASGATAPVKFDKNTFLNNVGEKGIVNFHRAAGFWVEFTDNTMTGNYTTTYTSVSDPTWGGQLTFGEGGAYPLDSNTAHVSKITGNTFTNTTNSTTYKQNAIFWRGNVTSSSNWDSKKNSNLQITGNTFAGYTGVSIYLRSVGGVRVQNNEFKASNAHVAAGSSHPYFSGEQTDPAANPAHGAPRYLLNGSYANQEVKPWLVNTDPTKLTYSQYECWAAVYFERMQSMPVPYVVDIYASSDEGIPGDPIVSRTVTEASTSAMQFKLPLDQVAGKYLRTQVTSYANGVYQSSQFGTGALVPNLQCVAPDYTITKQGYTDSSLKKEIPSGDATDDGTDVYWKYTVKNNRLDVAEPLKVTVRDDRNTDPKATVCLVELDPGQSKTCTWHQVIHPDPRS
jgi:hypothetical protein